MTLGTMAFIFGTARKAEGTPVLAGAQGPLAFVAANLFVVAFGMSWGPVVWVLLGETFPNRMRAAALSFAACGQWIADWLITVSFPSLKDISLGLAYGFYTVCAILSFIFVPRSGSRKPRARSWRTCTPRWRHIRFAILRSIRWGSTRRAFALPG